MDNDKKINISIGGNFITLLTITFVVLKLCGIINWSWFWVLSPLIFSLGIGVVVIIVVFIILWWCNR